jgi:hypothetical protein
MRQSSALVIALVALTNSPLCIAEEPKRLLGPDTPVEILLGRHGREMFRHQLETRIYGEKSHSWAEYAAWGHDLLVKGTVEKPPLGPSPSVRLSKSYRCVHCHNLVREDARLLDQDPEARERLLLAAIPAHGETRDGSIPSLVPATTFWGAINRTRFYNGYFEKYNSLRVADGSRMNPERIADAIQICSRFCSAGRYPEPWELDSLLAALWELELTMKDLDLPPDAVTKITTALEGSDAAQIEAARALVRASYLKVSGAEPREKPRELKKNVDLYEGGTQETGEAARGALVFRASCGGCHGSDVAAPLVSARQLADVRAYLASLKGG